MSEDTGCVVVLLPEHISSANAEQILNRLVWVIDHKAAVVVADLTATSSCDPSGARALLQAYQCGVAAGTELRLVVTAEAVRRALRLGGLAHLVLMFATPAAALADLREGRSPQRGQVLKTSAMSLDAAGAGEPGQAPQADHALLDSAVGSIFKAALSLQGAAVLSPERVADALEDLDGAIGDIREYVFAANGPGRQPGTGPQRPPGMSERITRNAQRTAALNRQLAATARALHAASAEAAALTAQRSRMVEEPHRIDYHTKIKSWHAIADSALRMAEIYEDSSQSLDP